MRRSRITILIAALCWSVTAVAALAQQDTARARRPEPSAQDRKEGRQAGDAERLRSRLMTQFLDHASKELDLTEDQTRRLHQEFGEVQEKRRSLIREQRAVRLRLEALNQEGRASDDEARQLLQRAADLKAREAELWREEQERIGRVLTPAQQARFLMLQERFAERVRQMRQDRRRDPGERGARPQRPPDRRSPGERPPRRRP